MPEGKPYSQNNRKWAWLGFVIGASIVFHGSSSGHWPCDRNVFLTLMFMLCYFDFQSSIKKHRQNKHSPPLFFLLSTNSQSLTHANSI